MNGFFAALMFTIGFWDMGFNYCPDQGCLQSRHVSSYDSYSVHQNSFNGITSGNEIYLRRKTGHANGPFENIWGLSISDNQEIWAGMGHAIDLDIPQTPLTIQLSAMTGLYHPGQGIDLGGPIEFRSGIEVQYDLDNGWRLGAGWDHRSNLEIYKRNPGLETVYLRLSVPVTK